MIIVCVNMVVRTILQIVVSGKSIVLVARAWKNVSHVLFATDGYAVTATHGVLTMMFFSTAQVFHLGFSIDRMLSIFKCQTCHPSPEFHWIFLIFCL